MSHIGLLQPSLLSRRLPPTPDIEPTAGEQSKTNCDLAAESPGPLGAALSAELHLRRRGTRELI